MSQGTSQKAVPGSVRVNVASNDGGSNADISGGIVEFKYFESILSDTVSASVTFVDTGGVVKDETVLDGLPITGTEKVAFFIEDNNGKSIGQNLFLYVNSVTPVSEDGRAQIIKLDLRSKEYFINNKVRLSKKFTGKISDNITNLLTSEEFLGSDKNVDIEDTVNNYNFIGNLKKPFYTINWLSKKGVPVEAGEDAALEKTAGFFFWETYDGYKFKSIDSLLDKNKNPKKRSIVFTETPDQFGADMPRQYTTKALTFSKNNLSNMKQKYNVGAYSTKTVLFNPFTCYYEVRSYTAEEFDSSYVHSGQKQPVQNPEFRRAGESKDFSRTTYFIEDTGTLPPGDTEEQLKQSKEQNFEYTKILNQSIMRYNQLFTSQVSVTISGDFELRAGDMVYIDSPGHSENADDPVNKQSGGLYIISELCHYLSPEGTYTKLNLVRDSFGRKGSPSA